MKPILQTHLLEEPILQPCPTVEHSICPCIIREPKQWSWATSEWSQKPCQGNELSQQHPQMQSIVSSPIQLQSTAGCPIETEPGQWPCRWIYLHTQNYKIMKKVQINGKIPHVHVSENYHCQNGRVILSFLYIQCTLYQNSNNIFYRNGKCV